MFERITLKADGARYVDDICEVNGFRKNIADGTQRHHILREKFITSPANSERLWEKNGRLFLFDGWSGLEPEDRAYWTEIQLVDVTELVKGSATHGKTKSF